MSGISIATMGKFEYKETIIKPDSGGAGGGGDWYEDLLPKKPQVVIDQLSVEGSEMDFKIYQIEEEII